MPSDLYDVGSERIAAGRPRYSKLSDRAESNWPRVITVGLVFLVWVGGWGFVDSFVAYITDDLVSRMLLYMLITVSAICGLIMVLACRRREGGEGVVDEILNTFMATV